jgi:L-methionine (R)-S-oxide reductase
MGNHAAYANFDASLDRAALLETVLLSYGALAESQTNWVANLANCSSLLYHAYKDSGVNWAGFYVIDKENNNSLILGPFMGKVACQSIKIGQGVCGTAAESLKSQLVPNVEKFPGHIACDGMTKSEIVIPIVQNNSLVGVLDIDCLELNGFNETDKEYLEKLCQKISETCKF